MPYMVTFTINIPHMLAYVYIPYMDPMGTDLKCNLNIVPPHPKLLEELKRFRIHIQRTRFSHFRLKVKVVIEWAMMAHRATLPFTTKHMSCREMMVPGDFQRSRAIKGDVNACPSVKHSN